MNQPKLVLVCGYKLAKSDKMSCKYT